MTTRPLTILLAEDDEGHATLIRRSLGRAGVANELVHVTDGAQAIAHVQAALAASPTPGPLLVLLDINMPRVDGFEVLTRLKAEPATASVPVIMLTTTDDPRDVDRCYRLGCSVFVTKPVAYDDFMEAVRRLGLLMQIVTVPGQA
jgi:CheY-like chemotaxis protein